MGVMGWAAMIHRPNKWEEPSHLHAATTTTTWSARHHNLVLQQREKAWGSVRGGGEGSRECAADHQYCCDPMLQAAVAGEERDGTCPFNQARASEQRPSMEARADLQWPVRMRAGWRREHTTLRSPRQHNPARRGSSLDLLLH